MTRPAAPSNHQLRAARKALLSPSGSGRPMSRQELADACNAELARIYDRQGRRRWAGISERTIGALERGEIRWPNGDYREALCAVLKMDVHSLGLYVDRPSHSHDETPAHPEGFVSARAFFGIGTLTLAVPLRDVPGRALPMIASEDARARDRLRELLERRLSFVVQPFSIPVSGLWEPHGDVVAICGPKSSPVTAEALRSDPVLSFLPDDFGHWVIRDRRTGHRCGSPMDDSQAASWSDVAYLGRLQVGRQRLLVIAGVHALGSVGAVDFLVRELAQLYAVVGDKCFSMVIGSAHDGDAVVSSEVVIPPCLHE